MVQLINKAEVPLRAATEENLKDHDKYFGFCGTCKLLVNIRPVVSHCPDRVKNTPHIPFQVSLYFI